MRALVVEDEPDIARAVAECLARNGFAVDVAANGHDGLWRASEGTYALIVLDLMLPLMGGEDVCRKIRAKGIKTPILVLTARTAEFDEVNALTYGADDFVRKPFSIDVLSARALALTRRGEARATPRSHGDIEYDPELRQCRVDGRKVHLTPREAQVLSTLLHAGTRPVSKQELLHSVWGLDFDGEPNVVDVYIRYLRQKLGPERIITIPRTGFRLEDVPDRGEHQRAVPSATPTLGT